MLSSPSIFTTAYVRTIVIKASPVVLTKMQHLTFVDIFNTNTVNPFNCCFKEKNTLICIEYDNKDVNINELIIEVKYI